MMIIVWAHEQESCTTVHYQLTMGNNNQDHTIKEFGENLISAIEMIGDLKFQDDGLYEPLMETVLKLENKIHSQGLPMFIYSISLMTHLWIEVNKISYLYLEWKNI